MCVFDHGVFTFTDVEHNVWPIILVTNPKNVLFNNPADLDVAKKSTHIRYVLYVIFYLWPCFNTA